MELELMAVVFMRSSFLLERGVHPPHYMQEFENTGIAKWVPVSARKERVDFFWDESEVKPKMGMGEE